MMKGYIQVEACEQGFLVVWDAETLAFTDRVDAAEWLLGWLGFNLDDITCPDLLSCEHDADELYNILSDCVAGIDYDELGDTDCLSVAEAAQAYVDSAAYARPGEYRKLAETVKKWQGVEGG